MSAMSPCTGSQPGLAGDGGNAAPGVEFVLARTLPADGAVSQMNDTRDTLIGIDVGATTISGGLVAPDGSVLYTLQTPTRQAGPGTALKTLLGVIDELLRQARSRDLSLAGVGVGVAGVVNFDKGVMLAHAENLLPDLAGVPLAEDIQSFTGLPTFVDNDANALALAEWMFGVGRGARSLVLFAIGTDVGGGVIVGDALIRGASGFAGEFHRLPVNIDGPRCYCGLAGCLALYVGGRGIAATARQRIASGARSTVLERAGGDPQAITSELVFREAANGDSVAKTIVDQACDALGAGIGFVVNCLDPEVVVVTGGVAQSLVPLADEVRGRAATYPFAPTLAGTRLHVIGGDKRRTVRGGAALVLYETRRRANGTMSPATAARLHPPA
jgi:glucokinase